MNNCTLVPPVGSSFIPVVFNLIYLMGKSNILKCVIHKYQIERAFCHNSALVVQVV